MRKESPPEALSMKLLFLFLLSMTTFAQTGDQLVHISAQNHLSDQNEFEVILEFDHENHWHTYWKNPGDSGLPIEFNYTSGDERISFSSYEWPAPKRHIEDGDIWTYGYEGKVYFIHKLKKDDLKGKSSINLNLKWLICKDICIPGKKVISAPIQEGLPQWPGQLSLSESKIKKIKENIPVLLALHDFKFELYKGKEDKELEFTFSSQRFSKINESEAFLIPMPSNMVLFKHPRFDSKSSGSINLEWVGHYNEPETLFPENYQFINALEFSFLVKDPKTKKSYIIEKSFTSFQKENTREAPPKKMIPQSNSHQKELPLWLILLSAFAGGLLLNLMPCVLPVISLKLFGLIKSKETTHKDLIKHNSLYSLGVFSTLLALGTLVILLKSSGEQVGWGFQLQNPFFLALMVVVLFIMTLNFFGLFEFITPGGNKLANAKFENSYAADFFSGVLATILATPCSAPFLGTALTFALTTSNLNVLITFSAIALGLCFPFIMTMIFPKMLNLLPKPGVWMEKFKYFLGLSLLFTCLWLLDVLIAITGAEDVLFHSLGLLSMIFFSIFYYQKISKNIFSTLVLAALVCYLGMRKYSKIQNSQKSPHEISSNNSLWKTWNLETIPNAIEKGEVIFVDFTAKWCLTCQVNKKAILHTQSFNDFAAKNNITLYQADWTRKNPDITNFLAEQNLVGIPAYFLIKNGKLHFLGETVSIQEMEKFF